MGHELQAVCHGEIRRLLWLAGIVFALILAFQYVELPYDNVFSSLFSAGKIPVAKNTSVVAGAPSYDPEVLSDVTLLDGLNTIDSYGVNQIANVTKTSEAEEMGLDDDPVSKDNDGYKGTKKESPDEKLLEPNNKNISVDADQNAESGPAPAELRDNNMGSVPSEVNIQRENDNMTSADITGLDGSGVSPLQAAAPPINSSPKITLPSTDIEAPVISVDTNTSSVEKDADSNKNEKLEQLHSDSTTLGNDSSQTDFHEEKLPETPKSAVVSINEMKQLLSKSRASYRSMKPRWSSPADKELLYARSKIENAPIIKNDPDLYAPVFQNVSTFKRSYELMEEILKVYIYKEGQRPILHQPVIKGIYASEGWFMKLLEANKKVVTKDPNQAHLFYLPFSSRMLEETLYVPNSHNHKNLVQYLKNYQDLIAARYPFWNRTEGADHFLVACHDWAPAETRPYMGNCIRALCNADVKEGFVFGKDVSLPETNVRQPKNPIRDLGGKPPSKRSILAFFAGKMHGYVRPILLQHWENKDPDMKIFGRMPRIKGKNIYAQHMKNSKYCVCPKGYEVNSPRIVEAILYECVPVIISDNYVPPFFEILNWKSFAIFVMEKDIPNLKNILLSISDKRYLAMQMRVKKVQQHFLWHAKPVKYDLFHMILHSIWYNRVFLARSR